MYAYVYGYRQYAILMINGPDLNCGPDLILDIGRVETSTEDRIVKLNKTI